MSISSGTISLFAGVGLAVGGAFTASFVLENPEAVKSVIQKYLPAKHVQQHTANDSLATQRPAGQTTSSFGDVVLRATSNGHYLAEAEINGRPIDVLVDTGATLVALRYEDAENAGIYLKPSDFTHFVSTANGKARVAPITIDRISIGRIEVRNVPGAVSERGALAQTLLGMTFLGRLSRVDMRGGELVLHE